MAPAKDLEAQISALAAAAELPPAQALSPLRKALTHRSNLLVSRAARHAARLELKDLTPDLIEAFHRFMRDPEKTDPQCWAKNDLAKTLAQFELQDPALFLLGLQHHQLEATWGGHTDTAGALRGTCALALVQCREINASTLLRRFISLLRDPDLTVRVNAARAIEQLGSDAAALLLRLRAELGSDSPELLGACIGGTLRLDGDAALPWVAAFLTPASGPPDELSSEAAFVLAEHRSTAAVELLQRALATAHDRDFRATLLSATASTRLPEATAWLLTLIAKNSLDAKPAAQALREANPTEETLAQLQHLGH